MTAPCPDPAKQPGTPEWLAANRRPYWGPLDHVYLQDPKLAEPEPTDAPPGSLAKLRELCARVEAGQDLWHPDDGPPDDD